MIDVPAPKPVFWISSSRADVRAFPKVVRQTIGQALFDAQVGEQHPDVKPLKGVGGGVLEIVESHDGSAYRAVYKIHYAGAVYVLHAFQKKSKSGKKTPAYEIEKVKRRLKAAKEHYVAWNRKRSTQAGEAVE